MSQTKIDISNLADSVVAALSVPKIATIDYPGDDTAADPAGGQLITLTGSGFNTGAQVYIDGTIVGVVTVLSSSELTFVSPAKSAGSYELRVVNTDGGIAASVNNIQYSGVPVWSTPSGSLANVYEGASVSNTLSATSDTAVTYSLTAGTLPTGVTLSGNSISGTTGSVVGNTTYNFTIDAIDAELQNTSRNFSIGVLLDTVTWSSPANNTTITANVDTTVSQTLTATAASGSNVTYTANVLPSGLTIVGNAITGNANVVANTTTLLTATSTQSGKTATQIINFQINSASIPPGQQEYTTPGTYSWVVPAGVTSISAVLIGGGGPGAAPGNPTIAGGGGGGGLRYINNLTVTPGETLTVVVGDIGLQTASSTYRSGGTSQLKRSTNVLVEATGGSGAASGGTGGSGTAIGAGPYGGTIGGGNGGNGTTGSQSGSHGGGGGAGGYSGNGGNGGSVNSNGTNNAATAGAGGGGGGGGASYNTYRGTGGGGVGIFGQGTNGTAGTSVYTSGAPSGGGGGSGGTAGTASSGNASKVGGPYGGGGGAFSTGWSTTVASWLSGAGGAVRIIWGTGRSFPSTNTQNM